MHTYDLRYALHNILIAPYYVLAGKINTFLLQLRGLFIFRRQVYLFSLPDKKNQENIIFCPVR